MSRTQMVLAGPLLFPSPTQLADGLELADSEGAPLVPRSRSRPEEFALDILPLGFVDLDRLEVLVHEDQSHSVPLVFKADRADSLTQLRAWEDAASLDLNPASVTSDGIESWLTSATTPNW